jgi:hypothetical protein
VLNFAPRLKGSTEAHSSRPEEKKTLSSGCAILISRCSMLITLLFRLRDRLLWQKGLVKW